MFWGDAEDFQATAERGWRISRKLVEHGPAHWEAAVALQRMASEDYALARELAEGEGVIGSPVVTGV